MTWPVPPAVPILPMIARMRSLAVHPNGRPPSTVTRIAFAGAWISVWVASTCSTSDVPMPKARAPNAPWVAVWLSPHTMVVPGRVKPCSGPMMWTMPFARVLEMEEIDPELLAVADQGVDLELGVLADRFAAVGGDVVVDDRDGGVGATHLASGLPQPLVGLRRGHFVGEVAVDVEQTGAVLFGRDDVAVPDFLEQGPWLRHPQAPGTAAGCRASGFGRSPRSPWTTPGAGRGAITARGNYRRGQPRHAAPRWRTAYPDWCRRGAPRIGENVLRAPRPPSPRCGCGPRSRAGRRRSCRRRSCRSGPRW